MHLFVIPANGDPCETSLVGDGRGPDLLTLSMGKV